MELMAKTKKAWHDTDDMGRKLKRVFDRLESKSSKISEVSELSTVANSMGHAAMQLVNIKRHAQTESKLERIEKLLEYIPKDVLSQAMIQVNASK